MLEHVKYNITIITIKAIIPTNVHIIIVHIAIFNSLFLGYFILPTIITTILARGHSPANDEK